MKRHRVWVLEEAEGDLLDLYNYVVGHDSAQCADALLENLEDLCTTLAELPLRGHQPPELERLGISRFREVHYKPYRVVYEVSGRNVFIHCVLGGRRDMQSLLERRLLR